MGSPQYRRDDWVRSQLASPPEDAKEYTLLHIAGRRLRRPDPELVEPYLERSDDPMLVRLALQILCNTWGLTDRYLEEVRRFVSGVGWDDGSVRLAAIAIAGRYLRATTSMSVSITSCWRSCLEAR